MIQKTILNFAKMKNYLFLVNDNSKYIDKNDNAPFISYILFISVILCYIIFMLLKQPNWVLNGEMWAEMATNYYPNANASSLYTNFFATDAGYVPFPQRVIAFIGSKLSFPASVIPYYYTWSSIIISAMMVGSFCLPIFRKIVNSDFLRFLVALSILIVVDFETRTFINFTYLVAFFCAIIIALSLVQNNKEEVPVWSWVLPFLAVSKPAVLSIIPIMLIASISSSRRFRLITLVTIVFIALQFLQLFISLEGGTFAHSQSTDISVFSKLSATLKYFFGFLGGYIMGPVTIIDKNYKILLGIIFFVISLIILFKKRDKNNALIIVGLSLVFFNVLLNCFAMSNTWNTEINHLNSLPLYRHIIVAYFGVTLILVGLISHISKKKFIILNKIRKMIYSAIFILWFVFSGWFGTGLNLSNEPKSPTINNSHWQEFSSLIDSNEDTVCVQINPIQWIYGRNCGVINQGLNWGVNKYSNLINKSIQFQISQEKQEQLNDFSIDSFSILIKPSSSKLIFIDAIAILEDDFGKSFTFNGQVKVSGSGGTLTFTKDKQLLVKNISRIKMFFNTPTSIAMNKNSPSILWMGR